MRLVTTLCRRVRFADLKPQVVVNATVSLSSTLGMLQNVLQGGNINNEIATFGTYRRIQPAEDFGDIGSLKLEFGRQK
jgi:hypothetical protein